MSLFFVKIANLFNYLILSTILKIINTEHVVKKKNTLLVIRLDAIGDYILFRNFLQVIRGSDTYAQYSITLCGNSAWKDIAETFDLDSVEEYIWLDRKKFYRDIQYKYRLLKEIHRRGFDTVIESTYSREILYGDAIVAAADSRIRIGHTGSQESHAVWKRRIVTDTLYTQLITLDDPNMFEFESNKVFFSAVLGTVVNIERPSIKVGESSDRRLGEKKFIVLFPGTNEKSRMWPSSHFREIADYVYAESTYDVVLSGSTRENYLFSEIVKHTDERFKNYFGITLPDLVRLIAKAALVISNDTSAVHFATAVNTPFICISNGSYFGRFNPYPKGMFDKGHYIYPRSIMEQLHDPELLKTKYRFGSDINIADVTPREVKELIHSVLPLQSAIK